jgi:hypothetical protein
MKVKNTYIGKATKETGIHFVIFETYCGCYFEQGLDADVSQITTEMAERYINNASPDSSFFIL